MNEQAIKAVLRIAFTEALHEVGFEEFKRTSMFPLSRRKAAAVELKRAA